MSHKCHAIGCNEPCEPKYLMCGKHWAMVPTLKQKAVYREYKKGQEEGKSLPTEQWHDAADAAIYAVRILDQNKRIKAQNDEIQSIQQKLSAAEDKVRDATFQLVQVHEAGNYAEVVIRDSKRKIVYAENIEKVKNPDAYM